MVKMERCSHCVSTKPAFIQAQARTPNVAFALIDGPSCPKFCKQMDIKGFPTFVTCIDGLCETVETQRDADSLQSTAQGVPVAAKATMVICRNGRCETVRA